MQGTKRLAKASQSSFFAARWPPAALPFKLFMYTPRPSRASGAQFSLDFFLLLVRVAVLEVFEDRQAQLQEGAPLVFTLRFVKPAVVAIGT